MIGDQFVWLVWSSSFLLPWLASYIGFPEHRRQMRWASIYTMPFGLSEPLFVPEYWNPPSLFNLAERTGFDIESLIFTFAIGGIGAVLYNVLTNRLARPIPEGERYRPLHRGHLVALSLPLFAFPLLSILQWNPIYPAILAMTAGAFGNVLCRPDLFNKTWIGGVLFLGYYVIFLIGLEIIAPGYIQRIWNLEALSGVIFARMPLEELLFAVVFGMYWSGIYEHFTWRRIRP